MSDNADGRITSVEQSNDNAALSEQVLSDSVMSEYQDMVNQQAQAAAAVTILGQPSKSMSLADGDAPPNVLTNHQVISKPVSDQVSKLITFVSHQPTSSTTHVANQIVNLLNLPSEGVNVVQPPATVSTVAPATPVSTKVSDGTWHNNSKKSANRRRSAAEREEKFKCTQCPYRSKWSHALSNHMRTHNNTVFKCEHCDYSTPWKGDLTNHLRVHTGNMFTCSLCDFETYRKQGLDKHMVLHTGAKPYKCSECDYSSSQPGNLKKHMMRHTGEKPISCDLCEYQCRQSSQLKHHVQFHHNVRAPAGQLPNKSSKASSNNTTGNVKGFPGRRASGRAVIGRNRKYTCILCRLSWTSRPIYTKHMLSKHSSTSSYKCGFICTRTFSSIAECNQHMASHDSLTKPTTCDASTCTSLDEVKPDCSVGQSNPTQQLVDKSEAKEQFMGLSNRAARPAYQSNSHIQVKVLKPHQPTTKQSQVHFLQPDQSSYPHHLSTDQYAKSGPSLTSQSVTSVPVDNSQSRPNILEVIASIDADSSSL